MKSLPIALPLLAVLLLPAIDATAETESWTEDNGRELHLRQPPVPGVEVSHLDVSKILYLNRCAEGCVIEPGANDARINTSTIVGSTSYISPWRHGEESWQELVACVREMYAPYDVEVTDVDPGTEIFHHEAIVAGTYDEIGYETPIGGVAPSMCQPANNVISFSFANGYPDDPINICSTVAQETAHSYGLEHAYDCEDPMTYLQSCTRQFFRDRSTPCGEFQQFDSCQCGGNAQNSHRWLRTVLGESTEPQTLPTINIVQPADGASVSNGFSIGANAWHLRGLLQVELFLNGSSYGTLEGKRANQNDAYWFDAPDNLPDSIIDVELVATNDIGVSASQTITVTKGAACATADSCLQGQECDEGRCIWPDPTGELGDECVNGRECLSGFCPNDGRVGYCSETCFPTTSENTCPDGFTCRAANASEGVCWPNEEAGGCGCRATSTGAPPAGMLLLAGAVGLIIRRRRRR